MWERFFRIWKKHIVDKVANSLHRIGRVSGEIPSGPTKFMFNFIAQGIMQYLSLAYSKAVWKTTKERSGQVFIRRKWWSAWQKLSLLFSQG